MSTNSNTSSKTSVKRNKWRSFKIDRIRKASIPKLWRSRRALLVVLLLASSAAALTSLGVRRAIRPASSLAHGATSASPVNAATAAGGSVQTAPPANLPLTKLREYVYAGGRLITSEEKSCVPTLNPAGASLPQGGGTGSFNVSTQSGCSWVATSSASWITITDGSSGAGVGTVSYSVTANSGGQRSGTITVNGQAFNITQAPNPGSCSYALNKASESVSEQVDGGSFTLTTGGGCPWTASSNAGWLSVTSATSGSGPATINYSVPANAGGQRIGVITVGGQTLTVTQAPNQASCTFALNPSSWLYPVGGGNGSFNVTTGAGCHWDANTTDGWITITGGATDPPGGGNGAVSFTVQANNGGSRTGGISVRGQVFTITQCGYEVSPTSAQFRSSGGTGSITVTAAAGCPWSATSNDEWIQITSGANGAGNGVVNYSVGGFSDECSFGRVGHITVAGRSILIGQTHTVQPCIINPTCCESSEMSAESRGLTARYFSNTTLSGQSSLERIDAAVSFNWTGASPDKLLPAHRFSVRWGGQLAAPSSEAYTFYLYSVGGARLWVNNRLVIDRWRSSFEPPITSAPVELKAGAKADIRVEYYNAGAEAMIHLLWSSASTPKQIIPRRRLYPEAANEAASSDANKQTGMLLPPGSNAGPKATWLQSGDPRRWLASTFGRACLALLIACGVLALLLRSGWRLARSRFTMAAAGLVSRLRGRILWLGDIMSLGGQKLAGLLPERVRAAAGRALSSWRSSGVARLKPVLNRVMVIALVVILATPLDSTQAEGLARAAQTTWREARAYTRAIANRFGTKSGGDLLNRLINMASGRRPGKAVSAASQEEQVAAMQVCPKRLIMFVGERYTLTPVALNSNQQVVHGARMSWSSLGDTIAKVSSFGQVEAVAVGNTAVEVQCGVASKQIPIEVRSGMRPTGSNQEADLDTTADCAAEQSAAFAPQSAAVADAQQDLIGENGVLLDWDPQSIVNSRATHFSNAVGSPRFAAKSQNVTLGSDNYQFTAPVANVGARGVSAGIGMTLNSRVWNNDNGKLTFNYVGAYPAPGWSMGYGKIIRNYNATATGDKSGVGSGNNPGDYLLVAGDGTRIRLAAKYDTAAGRWFHESDDGSFLRFDSRSGEMRYPDGSRMIYSSVNGCLLPTAMINSNGGAITMTYRDYCEGNCRQVFRHRTALSAVRDTLGRYLTFHYYGDVGLEYQADPNNGKPAGELAAIKAPDKDGVQQDVIKLEYQPITLKYNFGAAPVDAPANNSQIQVVRRIYYPQTGRGFLFLDYSSYGMPRKISSRMGMTGAGRTITDGAEIAYTTYDYTTIDPNDPYNRNQVGSLSDFPQFTNREEWRLGQTDASGAPTTDTTKYVYSRVMDGSKEVVTIKHVDKNLEEVTTTETDGGQPSSGKMVSGEMKNSATRATRSKQVLTYVNGPGGEAEIEKVETIDDAGQGTLMRFGYGPYGRVSDRYECGYKQAGDYQVRRRTHYDYVDSQSYLDARFLRLATIVSIYDAKNNNNDADDDLKAKTEFTYDDYAAMGGMQSYGLSANLYPPNHDSAYGQNKVIRGNLTAVKSFSKIDPEEATTRRLKFDIFGNVVEAEVSCCSVKSFNFSSATAYSQPDSIQSGGATGLNLKTAYQYNYFTGLVDNETNPDGQLTSYKYDNALRLNTVTAPTEAVTMTQFEQDANGNDLLTYISKTSYDDQGTPRVITSKQWFDGSGQVVRAGAGTGDAPDSYDMTATAYDAWGRVVKRSNPYLGDANGNPQSGSAQFWTVNTYDELSRVVKVTLPDTVNLPDAQTVQTAYNGATVTTTDTVGRKRKGEVDGFGRLVKMTEQNPANGALEWETSYSYGALDNLTQINQGGQLRTFTHDAKGRLISETTPEAGKTEYTYTDFDEVKTRTDARGVVTTYTYGPLNMLTGMSYNTASATGVAATAGVSLTYRTDSPGKGKIEMVTDGAGSESYGYDGFGRLESCTRVIDGISYEKRYEYNEAGQITLMTYPSGKRVKMERDDRGRLAALQRVDASGNMQEAYLSEINYRVEGLISSLRLGDGATESFGYSNDRLQLTSQTVTKGGATLLSLNYGYQAGAGQMGSGSTPGNSGQVVSVNGTVNGQSRNQAFGYDNVRRLVTATGWGSWARRFDYDRHGNRTAVWDAVSGGGQIQNTVIAQAGGIKTNRIASVDGITFNYDASGDLTGDGARTYTYDGEKRVVSVSGLGSESYGYDAVNHRVKKESGGTVTHYIWEGDDVIAEYERGGSATSATGTRYYHQDRLSTRIITNSAGAVVGTTDHLPFGEEVGRSGESEKHKFTSYERGDTGIDYAVNRHYDSRQGRFNQVDPLGMEATTLTDPQSLNLYSYTQNDPINHKDPTGLSILPLMLDDGDNGNGSFARGYEYTGVRAGGGGGGSWSAPIQDTPDWLADIFCLVGYSEWCRENRRQGAPPPQDYSGQDKVEMIGRTLQPVFDWFKRNKDSIKDSVNWKSLLACLADAVVNLALGLGLSSLGPIGAAVGVALDLSGTDLNFFQGFFQGKPEEIVQMFGPTDLAAGWTEIMKNGVKEKYEMGGGEAELNRAWRSARHLGKRRAPRQWAIVMKLKPLKRALSVLGPAAMVLEGIDFGYTATNCVLSNLKK